MLAPQGEAGFLAFSDLLTGYRQAAVLMLAHEAGIFAAVGREGCTGPELCAKVGWEQVYGERFLHCLCGLGLLRREEARYTLTPFSRTYLAPHAPHYQGQTLLFERQLHQSWQQLEATLTTGQRVFATVDKSPEDLQQALALYLGAMDEAARIRAEELWTALPMSTPTGTILDLGAGSGAFLAAFLEQNPGWSGIFCDLPEVVASAGLHQRLAGVAERLAWCACNLLADEPSPLDAIEDRSCKLVLLSNLIHCQGPTETQLLLAKAAAKTAEHGTVVIHDFCTDTGWRGAVYDLHMMLNTYNGQAYSKEEIVAMATSCGLAHRDCIQLPSGSTALVLARKQEKPDGLLGH